MGKKLQVMEQKFTIEKATNDKSRIKLSDLSTQLEIAKSHLK